jgi:hypothetical protein
MTGVPDRDIITLNIATTQVVMFCVPQLVGAVFVFEE